MQELPPEMLAAIEAATTAHPSDVDQATSVALAQIRGMPSFATVSEGLLSDAVRGRVYQCRHKQNVSIKRDAGKYGGPAKVRTGESKTVADAAWSVYDLRIGGTVLGDLRGSDLTGISTMRRQAAKGLEFDADLCEWLTEQGVTGEKRVREVVSEKKLAAQIERMKQPVTA